MNAFCRSSAARLDGSQFNLYPFFLTAVATVTVGTATNALPIAFPFLSQAEWVHGNQTGPGREVSHLHLELSASEVFERAAAKIRLGRFYALRALKRLVESPLFGR